MVGNRVLKRWSVHHGSQDLGLMTAKEIRDALRKGTLDPFDKVSAEGSNIREDLIEVDEIFQENDADREREFTGSVAQAHLPTADGAVPAQASGNSSQANSQKKPAPDSGGAKGTSVSSSPFMQSSYAANPTFESVENSKMAQQSSLASPSWRTADSAPIAKEDKDSKSKEKRYYLIDKSKVLGPLSALEIQSLFNRGGLNSKVKVQKIGGTKAIPIAQFISSFSEDRIKELTEDGKLNQKGSPSSKVLNELARAASAQKIAKDRKNKTYIIIALVGFVLGAIILIAVSSTQSSKKSASDSDEDTKKRPKLLQSQRSDEGENVEEPEPQRPRAKPAPAQPAAPRAATREVRETKKPTPRPQAPRATRPEPRSQPVVRETRPTPAPRPVAVVRPRTPEPPPSAPPAKREGPIERALSSGGGVQTVGPLSFSMTALEACPSKCTLTLRDSSGMTIKAVFFKSAYYDQLKKSGSNVFISGTVRREGGGAAILIQDVR